jgi:hypothetical protein
MINKHFFIKVGISIFLILLIASIFLISVNKVKNDSFKDGYLKSCQYHVPDGCMTCTDEEIVKEYCFKAKTYEEMSNCNFANAYLISDSKVQFFIFNENNSYGVRLR